MNIRYGLKLILTVGLTAGSLGSCAMAQSPAKVAGTGSYLVKLTALSSNTPEEAAARKHSVLASEVYWDNLYNVGKVAVLGSAQDGGQTFSVVILQCVSEAEAHSIAYGVPSVKAGVTSAEVLPMQLYQASASRPRSALRSH